MAVPFNDLALHHKNIHLEINAAIRDVVDNSSFIRGPQVEQFEQNFAQLTGQKYCISCANGTDALELVLSALNLEPQDEVITTAHSWIASASSITRSGGRVVFCDTSCHHCNIDVHSIEKKITPKTKGILVVHLFGCPAEMDKINALAHKHNLWIVEDCAQSHLAHYQGRQVGQFGIAATFSFYPGKNLGAMGDAGAIVTSNREFSAKVQRLARHGGIKKGEHLVIGRNSRMDGLQAAILSVKIKHIVKWTEERQKLAARYIELLDGLKGIKLPKYELANGSVFHLFVIETKQRDKLREYLKEKCIETIINYPIALPFLPVYEHLKHKAEDFPNAYKKQAQILSLPLFPEMSISQQDEVVEAIKKFFV